MLFRHIPRDFCQVGRRADIGWQIAEFPGKTLPGGNALAFDWLLLKDWQFPLPWMLAGGLDAGNVAEAVRLSGARYVDTSSGVEDRPGVKNPDKIRQFLKAVAANG